MSLEFNDFTKFTFLLISFPCQSQLDECQKIGSSDFRIGWIIDHKAVYKVSPMETVPMGLGPRGTQRFGLGYLHTKFLPTWSP